MKAVFGITIGALIAGAAFAQEPAAAGAKTKIELSDEVITDSPLYFNGRLGGEIELVSGQYNIKRKVIAGHDGLKKEDPMKRATITIAAGSSFEGEEVYINEGDIAATGSVFRKMRLTCDLGGKWSFKDCILDECVLQKGGAWFAGYSAKFEIENCVLRSTPFVKWTRNNIGVIIKNSTFLDTTFESAIYRSDAAREINEVWRTIENCRFVRCHVPLSVALMTKNCVFEDCTFGENEYIPLVKKIETTLYHSGTEFEVFGSKVGGWSFKVADGSELETTPGSTLQFTLS
ncbi:MAG: hypothetical protein AAF585_03435, partial [Verrucomicrobiota bacterium]